MRVLPAFMQRSLSPSSMKTDISACMRPIVDASASESVANGDPSEIKTGFPASVRTKYWRRGADSIFAMN